MSSFCLRVARTSTALELSVAPLSGVAAVTTDATVVAIRTATAAAAEEFILTGEVVGRRGLGEGVVWSGFLVGLAVSRVGWPARRNVIRLFFLSSKLSQFVLSHRRVGCSERLLRCQEAAAVLSICNRTASTAGRVREFRIESACIRL